MPVIVPARASITANAQIATARSADRKRVWCSPGRVSDLLRATPEYPNGWTPNDVGVSRMLEFERCLQRKEVFVVASLAIRLFAALEGVFYFRNQIRTPPVTQAEAQ